MIIMIFMTTTTKQTQHDAVAAADISTWCNTSRTLSARSSCRTCCTHHQCIIERQPVTQNINALWNVIELNEYIQPLNTFLFSHTSYQYMNKILGYVENFQIGMFFHVVIFEKEQGASLLLWQNFTQCIFELSRSSCHMEHGACEQFWSMEKKWNVVWATKHPPVVKHLQSVHYMFCVPLIIVRCQVVDSAAKLLTSLSRRSCTPVRFRIQAVKNNHDSKDKYNNWSSLYFAQQYLEKRVEPVCIATCRSGTHQQPVRVHFLKQDSHPIHL